MTEHKYGTREFYKEMFADLICDIHHDQPEITENVINGFFDALTDWRSYYAEQYSELNNAIRLATTKANEQRSI